MYVLRGRSFRPGALGGWLLASCLALAVAVLYPARAAEPEPSPKAKSSPEKELFFESDVRPILKLHCFHCHGEEPEPEAQLDLRLVRWMTQGGDSGPAVSAGKPDESLLWQRIAAGEMPPSGKGLSEDEKHILRRWLEQGAKTRRAEPESLDEAGLWTEEERNYWAFQRPVRGELPPVEHAELVDTPIDRFLLAQLEQVGLSYSSEADRRVLARRLSFDLLGLPPTPAMLSEFVDDASADAYERLVDRLLASPAYGERWARHWLDTAGYADSDGYSEKDAVRPWAYRYRDYVIRSLNESKPLDQWIVEQLAGDELVAAAHPDFNDGGLSEEEVDKLIATGFLRMAPDGSEDGGVDVNLARNDVIAETVKIVSTSLLGLTVGCAQCHDHRYDPISQVDYYRFRAVFEPAFDTKNWRSKQARLVNILSPEERQRVATVDRQLKELDQRQTAELDCIVDEIFDRELKKLPEEMQERAIEARQTKADKRSDQQKQIMKDHPSLNVSRGSAYLYEPGRLKDFNARWDALKTAKRAERPADQSVACLSEVPGQVPPTYVFFRGDLKQPRQTVEPGQPGILPETAPIPTDDDYVPTTGRRLALARNLTSGRHPLTARVLVNRVWMHHFGRGIVASPGDFGVLGERPSHAELLDWLAVDLAEGGWDLKRLQRMLVCSRAYRQVSLRSDALDAQDPDNRLLGRMPVRRLEAEAIRDAMIDVAGMRTGGMFGPPAPVNPDDVGQVIVGSATRDGNGIMVAQSSDDPQQYRRSIYVQVRRSMPLGVLEPFDLPALSPNCDRRTASTVAPQALLLMNNQVSLKLAERFAQRLVREVGDDPQAQVRRGLLLAFGVDAAPSDIADACRFLDSQRTYFAQQAADQEQAGQKQAGQQEKKADQSAQSKPAAKKSTADAAPLAPDVQALALFCQALLSSNQFLYVD